MRTIHLILHLWKNKMKLELNKFEFNNFIKLQNFRENYN